MSSFIYEVNLGMLIGCNSRPHLRRKDINDEIYDLYPWENWVAKTHPPFLFSKTYPIMS